MLRCVVRADVVCNSAASLLGILFSDCGGVRMQSRHDDDYDTAREAEELSRAYALLRPWQSSKRSAERIAVVCGRSEALHHHRLHSIHDEHLQGFAAPAPVAA